MKYDISSLMVTVTEEHMPFWQFLVRLCGIIGGIFSTTGNCQWFPSILLEFFGHHDYVTDELQGSPEPPAGLRETARWCALKCAMKDANFLCPSMAFLLF